MLVITGSGRCGTSVLTRFCHNVGFVTGGSWNHDFNAGMEDTAFVAVSNSIQNDEVDDDVIRYVTRFPRKVVKDPRFLTPKVAGFWAERRKDLKVLVCVRDMKHVAASVFEVPIADDRHLKWVTNKTHEMISAYVELARHRVPMRFLAFPHFLDDYEHVHKMLEWGGLSFDYDIGKRVWSGLVNKEMVHHK